MKRRRRKKRERESTWSKVESKMCSYFLFLIFWSFMSQMVMEVEHFLHSMEQSNHLRVTPAAPWVWVWMWLWVSMWMRLSACVCVSVYVCAYLLYNVHWVVIVHLAQSHRMHPWTKWLSLSSPLFANLSTAEREEQLTSTCQWHDNRQLAMATVGLMSTRWTREGEGEKSKKTKISSPSADSSFSLSLVFDE